MPLTQNQYITIISVYAPTLDSSDEAKDEFYESLDLALRTVPINDKILLIGDFNAHVGSSSSVWNGTLGKHGIAKMNSNGLRLLTLCSEHQLCITNTVFQPPNIHKGTWMHPCSRKWHILDYVFVK